jgi:hypothetical protein
MEDVGLDLPQPKRKSRGNRRRLYAPQLPDFSYPHAVDILYPRERPAVAYEDLHFIFVFEMVAELRDMLFHSADHRRIVVLVDVQDFHRASEIVRL